MQNIEDWENVDRAVFENEILPAGRPAVLRGLLREWPAVRAAQESRTGIVDYIKRLADKFSMTLRSTLGSSTRTLGSGATSFIDQYNTFTFGAAAYWTL